MTYNFNYNIINRIEFEVILLNGSALIFKINNGCREILLGRTYIRDGKETLLYKVDRNGKIESRSEISITEEIEDYLLNEPFFPGKLKFDNLICEILEQIDPNSKAVNKLELYQTDKILMHGWLSASKKLGNEIWIEELMMPIRFKIDKYMYTVYASTNEGIDIIEIENSKIINILTNQTDTEVVGKTYQLDYDYEWARLRFNEDDFVDCSYKDESEILISIKGTNGPTTLKLDDFKNNEKVYNGLKSIIYHEILGVKELEEFVEEFISFINTSMDKHIAAEKIAPIINIGNSTGWVGISKDTYILKEIYPSTNGYTVRFNNPNPIKPTEFYYVTYSRDDHDETPIGSTASIEAYNQYINKFGI